MFLLDGLWDGGDTKQGTPSHGEAFPEKSSAEDGGRYCRAKKRSSGQAGIMPASASLA